MDHHAVWITGIGALTPVGCDFASVSQRLLAGKSAAQIVTDANADGPFRSPGCFVEAVPVPLGWNEPDFRALTRLQQLTVSSCQAALRDAGWWGETDGLRVGLVLGSGGEWLYHWETNLSTGGRCLHDGIEPDGLPQQVQQWLGIRGPATTIAAACASGNYAFALGRQWIRQGLVDICLAAGLETTTPMCRAAFHNLRALSRRTDDATLASRPFDRDRDGFVMGEGAVTLVLESAAIARQRGARVFGELAGFGASSDAHHMIIPSQAPEPAAMAIRAALDDAQVEPSEVDYINAHATSTPVGDLAEARALHRVFGQHVRKIPVSSTKSMTGHLLSAAAAMEAVATLVAVDQQALPPTINLDHPDPECDLLHVRHHATDAPVRVAISNSFGFGGSNTCLVLRRVA